MRTKLFAGVAFAALLLPASAYAQSTGTIDAEEGTIVVSGSRTSDVAGVQVPDTSKTRQVLTSEFIQRQVPGQSINEVINQMPGVSFQNNDPYGSSGGTLTIRGFDSSRISQTFDGIPLNDTGNYAIYSSQQLDPELIEQVNVSLGSTDVDSPTAAATGSTVNYRSIVPSEDFHAKVIGSAGDWNMFRVFGLVETGNLTSFGTRAWVSASHQSYENPYNRAAKVDKAQYNAKLYQPIGGNGDFVSVAGHLNISRNQNFTSGVLRTDPTVITVTGPNGNQTVVTAPRVVGTATSNRFPTERGERNYSIPSCTIDVAQANVADTPSGCGTAYDYSFNPSNTANVRASSRFTLADGLVLTVDPSYTWTRANGGKSDVKSNEGFYTRAANANTGLLAITTPIFGYIGGQPYFGGVDLNGDGDKIDTPGRTLTGANAGALTSTGQGVTLYAPSHTETNRYILISSLRYELSPEHTVRIAYTHDYGIHRQTGELGMLQLNGFAKHVFPKLTPLLDATGNPIEKRNRRSRAILDQISGEYRGEFGALQVNAGVRAPFFKRKLNNLCVSESGSGIGFVDCFNDAASQAAFLAANPSYAAPQQREFKYNAVLPSAGFTFDLAPSLSLFGNYSKGLQVPGTDNLYQSFAFPVGTDRAKPKPEKTDNFDAGLRYRSSKVQAQLAGWYTLYNNRLASAYDPELDVTIYRNLGTVDKYGVDASVAFQPIRQVSLYAYGSYLKSKIRDNVVSGECTAANVAGGLSNGIGGTCTTVGQSIYAPTEGKRELGAPVYTFGGRAELNLDYFQFGVQAKRTGSRYINDVNLPVTQSYSYTTTVGGAVVTNNVSYQVYDRKTPAYTVVDLDLRMPLTWAGVNDRTYLQFNLTNLFDKLYVAGFSGNLSSTSVRNAYIGAPRTFMGSLVVGF
ncbi:TonB-dependent receptor [Sphingomonas sp. MMS12-HWE2-04]|uniref:TonB-dependent receptor n=1 Tax=Sphingomonas sp. MMS12-HWE2-04 TaxID=3234199 RepID=UPI00384AA0AC